MTESEILTKSNTFQCSKHQHSNPTMFSEILKIKHKSKTRSMSRARYRSLYIVHTSALVFSLGFSIVLTGFQLKISWPWFSFSLILPSTYDTHSLQEYCPIWGDSPKCRWEETKSESRRSSVGGSMNHWVMGVIKKNFHHVGVGEWQRPY